MAEVASSNLQESRLDLAPKGQEFFPDADGVVRVQTPHGLVTIVNGRTADGEESAMVFGVDSSPELVLGENNAAESTGFLSGLPRNPLGRIAAGITMAAGAVVGAGAALSACDSNADHSNQPSYGTHQGALNLDQILSVGNGQDIPWSNDWSNDGDNYPSNLGQMNGENYLFAARGKSAATQPYMIVYVKCQNLADCFSPNAEVKTLQGLEDAGMYGPYFGSGLFKDKNGKDKFIVDPSYVAWDEINNPLGLDLARQCDIATNNNGILEVSNCVDAVPPCKIEINDNGLIQMVNCDGELPPVPVISGTLSTFTKNGVPYTLWAPGKMRNLHTNETQKTALYDTDWANACGVGVETEDGTAVIGSQMQVIQGVVHCRLVTASSWAELVANPIALQSLNQGSKKVRSPRLFGNYIVYVYNYKLRFVEIPAPQNPEPNTGSPDTDADQPDAGSPDADTDQPDAVDGPDADVAEPDAEVVEPDAADQDSGPEADTAEVAEDTADAAEAVVEPDTGPDTPAPDADTQPPDTQPPDTTPNPCSFATPKLTIPPGCQLENCTDPFVDITGKCIFSVDLGKSKPVTVELDGTYKIDFLEKIGTHLAGKYKLVDNGNKLKTAVGNLMIGVEGTTYSGEFMDGSDYLISCQEGIIKIFLKKLNEELEWELLAILDGGEDHTFDLSNPNPLTEPDPESQPEPQPEEAPDASQPEAVNDIGSPKPEPASDTGPSQPEPNQPETKDTTPPPSKSPSNDGGCNITGNLNATAENPNSTGHLATIAMALIALGATLRRRHE